MPEVHRLANLIPEMTEEQYTAGIGFFGWYEDGAVRIYPSELPGLWHCRVFEMATRSVLDTKRPLTPEGVWQTLQYAVGQTTVPQIKWRTELGTGMKPSAEADQGEAEPKTKRSSVYFIQAGDDNGPVKIGYTVDIDRRLASVQCGSPVKLRLLYTEPGTRSTESALHRRFKADRLHGEWFTYSDRLREYLDEQMKSV